MTMSSQNFFIKVPPRKFIGYALTTQHKIARGMILSNPFLSYSFLNTLSLFILFSSFSTSQKCSFSPRRTFVKTLCTRRGPRSRRLFRPYPSRSCSDETSRSFFSPLFVYRLEVERNGFSIWFSRRWMERWVSKRRRRRMADRSTRLSLIAPGSVLAWCATFPCSCATAGRVLTTTL